MTEAEIVEKAEHYAIEILSNLPDSFSYHNLQHTKEVVEAIKIIGENEKLKAEDLNKLLVAAWFHDLGYNCDESNHEEESVKLLNKELTEWGVAKEKIENIGEIILSTKMPQTPKNELSEIMCDADLYHLSTASFQDKTVALKNEIKSVCNKDMTDDEWTEKTIEFIKSHQYFTDFGKRVLEPKKLQNLTLLEKGEKKRKKSIKKLEKQVLQLEEKLVKAKTQKPDRGIETMFRITSKNHLQLSAMADNKANIMISINSIILSVLVSVLFRKFDDYPQLIIPALILVVVCLTTIVFAVLATRPNVSSGKFTRDEIREKKTNLLFFGNFHGMELDNYMWGMKEMMKDADFLYGSMIKDIYFLGIVLGKKYRMLRKSYNVFMFGFIIAISSFVIALLLFPESA